MADENFIKFLGTAGARFVVAKQLRYSGGVFLHLKGQKVILDPGPGTLVRCARSRPKIDPTRLDAVILTHAHIDHSNDVNVMADAMVSGGFKRRGALFAPSDCLEGENAVVLNYVRQYLDRIEPLKPETKYQVGPLSFHTSVRHKHGVETYGLKFDLNGRTLAFLMDTEYFDGLAKSYADAEVLVMNVVRRYHPQDRKIQHLSMEEAREILSQIRPEKTIITHFGMTMIKAKPWEVAAELAEELGLDVRAASDGMKLDLED